MSNIINNFPAKLVSVARIVKKNSNVYLARFEDGSRGIIRTSGRVYNAVAQVGTLGVRTDFLFSSTGKPSGWRMHSHIATVQVEQPEPVAS